VELQRSKNIMGTNFGDFEPSGSALGAQVAVFSGFKFVFEISDLCLCISKRNLRISQSRH